MYYLFSTEIEEKKSSVYVPPSKRGIIGGAGVSAPKKDQSAKPSPAQNQSTLSDREKKMRAVKKVSENSIYNW
jgi:hypothetical protein